ncbi:4Fe-4S dicluster domain-containing protein [Methanobrevibacter sp. UBA313]|jgi:2-oxoglutarate ferredoxin oxidoreductase subunit delta|uniref:4Fe-4S dicluster domain-containing protein n=1 Tax=Methanobrevibacter sp. UBA313 TaxID=1915477 RepID=UPI0039B8296E
MIYINSKLCKGCDICIITCQKDVFEKSKEKNSKDVYLPFPKNEEKCNVCGLCELSCPDQAIAVDKKED